MNPNDPCLFCNIEPSRIIVENELAYAIYDGFPVTESHTLVIPKNHARHYFSMTQSELLACHELLHELQARLIRDDPSISGFNIGMNCGEHAGQTIFHCHIHLIPRRAGDVENPRGGIRHIIPNKGFY